MKSRQLSEWKKWASLFLLGGVGLTSGAAMASAPAKVETHGGIKVTSGTDPNYWAKLGARFQLDETVFSGSARNKQSQYPNSSNIRRAYLTLDGGVGCNWAYQFWYDFAAIQSGSGVGTGSGDFVFATINYLGFENTIIQVGQRSTIPGLTNNTPFTGQFLEAPLSTAFFTQPLYVLGITARTAICDMFTLSAQVYEPRTNTLVLNGNYLDSADRSDKIGETVRLTYAPIHTECESVHIGLGAKHQSVNWRTNANRTQLANQLFTARPETFSRLGTGSTTLVNAGPMRMEGYNVVNAELGASWGPATFMGEFFRTTVLRLPRINQGNFTALVTTGPNNQLNDVGNVRFDAWNVQAGWVLTGESRMYNFLDGHYDDPKPSSHYGAWEIAARLSSINLVDKNIYGGSEHNATIGLNWYPNDTVKIMLNYIRASIHPTSQTAPGTPPAMTPAIAVTNPNSVLAKRRLNIFSARFQVMF